MLVVGIEISRVGSIAIDSVSLFCFVSAASSL